MRTNRRNSSFQIEKPIKYTLKDAGVTEWDIKFLNIEDTEEYDKIKNDNIMKHKMKGWLK